MPSRPRHGGARARGIFSKPRGKPVRHRLPSVSAILSATERFTWDVILRPMVLLTRAHVAGGAASVSPGRGKPGDRRPPFPVQAPAYAMAPACVGLSAASVLRFVRRTAERRKRQSSAGPVRIHSRAPGVPDISGEAGNRLTMVASPLPWISVIKDTPISSVVNSCFQKTVCVVQRWMSVAESSRMRSSSPECVTTVSPNWLRASAAMAVP